MSSLRKPRSSAKRVSVVKSKRKYPKRSYAKVSGSGDYRSTRTIRRPIASAIRGHGDYYFPILSGNSVSFMNSGVPHSNNAGANSAMVKGSGDYATGAAPDYNVLVNSHQIPQFASAKMTNVVCHREYITDIITSATPGAFNIQSFNINAGQSDTFPWLSALALNYEQYKVHGMVFEFRTMSVDSLNSTNTALGQVIMACEYNSANPNFVNKQQMENYEYAISVKPSCSAMCAIECAKGQTPLTELYVRGNAVPSGQDQRLYDLGNFQIATNGMQAASVNVGELWVSYCVELLKPRLQQGAIGDGILSYHAQLDAANVASSTPLGSGTPTKSINTGAVDHITSTKIFFDPNIQDGQYLCVYSLSNGTSVTFTSPLITGTNCTISQYWRADAQTQVAAPQNGATSVSNEIVCFIATITAANATVNFGVAGTISVPQTSDLFVTQLNGNINL